MKTVAFISEHASPLAILGGIDNGGQNVYVAEVGKALTEQGFKVDIYTRRDDVSQPEVVEWLPGIRVIHIKAGPEQILEKESLLGYMHEFTENMVRFITREQVRYSIIHAHFFMSALVASALKKLLHLPYVVTFHALGLVRKAYQKEMDRFPPERCTIERFIVRDADQILAECPQDKADLIYYYNADPARITIIPCGFNPEEFQPYDRCEARKKLGLPPDTPILLQLGRMVPRKGIDNVIHALGRLSRGQDHTNVRLVVVGGNSDQPDPSLTPELGRLREIAWKEGVLDQVRFTGRKNRDQLRYYYAAADIFITTPWYEPFGITPLEAMACGIPVIGSDTGGIKYSVSRNKTGFLIPPNDPDALAEKIRRLLSDKKLAEKMGRNAIRRVYKLFTWRKVSEQVASVYQEIDTLTRKEAMLRRRPLKKEIFSPLNAAGTMFQQPFVF